MKKKAILGILFLLPITIVLILLFTKHNYTPLPVIKNNVAELVNYKSYEEKDTIQFDEKITVLGFLGASVKERGFNILTLNQKIYKRFSGFTNFFFV